MYFYLYIYLDIIFKPLYSLYGPSVGSHSLKQSGTLDPPLRRGGTKTPFAQRGSNHFAVKPPELGGIETDPESSVIKLKGHICLKSSSY